MAALEASAGFDCFQGNWFNQSAWFHQRFL